MAIKTHSGEPEVDPSADPARSDPVLEFPGLDGPLRDELPTFEVFFKTFGFKRILGRVWGLMVLAGQPISSKEISAELGISQGATSTAVNELAAWGAVVSEFDSARRCHLHRPVGNTMSIVATVLRRREQVVFSQFKQGAERALNHVDKRYGPKDPRALTLRSIISSCEIAEALMQLIFGAVGSALGDPQSLLSRTITRALRVGLGGPAKLIASGLNPEIPVREAKELEQQQLEDSFAETHPENQASA
jgi:DNA-binding MarR family transcriptional regulator